MTFQIIGFGILLLTGTITLRQIYKHKEFNNYLLFFLFLDMLLFLIARLTNNILPTPSTQDIFYQAFYLIQYCTFIFMCFSIFIETRFDNEIKIAYIVFVILEMGLRIAYNY
jgi:hypothetical protein